MATFIDPRHFTALHYRDQKAERARSLEGRHMSKLHRSSMLDHAGTVNVFLNAWRAGRRPSVDRARMRSEFMRQAVERGMRLTPEVMAKIDAQIEATL
jgi:hypothetical protein